MFIRRIINRIKLEIAFRKRIKKLDQKDPYLYK